MFISKKALAVSPSSTLAINSKFKAMKAEGIDVVGFGTGEPDFDTPENIKTAAKLAIDNGFTKYTPASGTNELKNAICYKLKRDNGINYDLSNIVVSNGAKHSLMNVFTAICDPGDEIIIPSPFWVSYPEIVRLADGVPVIVDTLENSEFKLSAEDFEKAITPKTRGIIINSPGNPNGMVYSKEELKALADVALKHGLYIVSDEVYEHLTYDGHKHISIASFGPEYKEATIIVNAVSKTYSMTGWRIGYTASSEPLAKAMANIQSHSTSNPNSIAQIAATEALIGDLSAVEMMKKEFVKRRDYMCQRINKIKGVSCKKPQGAFYILLNISQLKGKTLYGKTIKTSDDFGEILLEKALVAVVPCSGFGNDDFVRLSYATSMETIIKGMDRLETFLNEAF
ncbi:MAG: pyridoxal phosphate-dependent aminotransferase [Clostridia bacterium]|nr:pyridoxal phosphate-dependent aminotransferase [Clostridia bacterium]